MDVGLYLFCGKIQAVLKKIQAKGGLCWGKDKRRRTNGGKDKRRRTNVRRTREKQRQAEGERLRLYLRGIASKIRHSPHAEQPMLGSSRGTRLRMLSHRFFHLAYAVCVLEIPHAN